MFAFLKDMIAAVKEGAAEGSAEAQVDIDAAKAEKAAADAQRTAALNRRLALASPAERLITALAAPYRETFLGELAAAKDAQRQPVHLFCMDLPGKEPEAFKGLLSRDFGIEDGAQAAEVVASLLDLSPDASDGAVAVAIVRACHIASAAAGTNYVEVTDAMNWAAPAIRIAAERFAGWPEYGAAFIAGEKDAPGSNILGRKFLARAVTRLQDEPASPWRTLSWPVAG